MATSPNTLFAQIRLASAFGEANIGGQSVIVHLTVAVPPGLDGNSVAQAALRDQGARPFQPAEFSLTGLVWDQYIGTGIGVVERRYNPAGAVVATELSLENAQDTWSGVLTSKFSFLDGGTSSVCPSLVKACKGRQTFDDSNDVG